jgi:anti-anti-sigma factor
MPKRVALLIANQKYKDEHITQLNAPMNDTDALYRLLINKKYGEFDSVTRLTNKSSSIIRKEIARLYKEGGSEDLILLYLSGHGVRLDKEFYFLTNDSEVGNIEGTSLDANYIWQRFNKSYSRRRIIIIDSCNSGSFAVGMKSMPIGSDAGISESLNPESKGYIVLMSSDSLQAAFEGKQVNGLPSHSIFTEHLISGIESGDADFNKDGRIDIEELFHYIRGKMEHESQTPKILLETDGPFYISAVPKNSLRPIKSKYGVSVIKLSVLGITELDAKNSEVLQNELESLIKISEYRIVIDLSGVNYLASSGIATIVRKLQFVRKNQGDIKLTSVCPEVLDVLEMIGFTNVFKIFPSVEEGVEAFKK